MDDELMERQPGDVETYRRIDAYGYVRLAPNATAMAGIRSTLVAEATLRAAMRVEDVSGHSAALLAVPRAAAPAGRPLRRVAVAFLAASLSVGAVAGSAAASTAGGPLYGPRLWLEEITLPSDGLARSEAQLTRLDNRLAELRTALASGNAGGAAAALEAYGTIVAELDVAARSNDAVATTVADDVSRHLVVLEALVGHVPPQAQDALNEALDRSDSALDNIGRGGPSGGTDPEPGSGRPANAGGPDTGNGNGPVDGNGDGEGNGDPGESGAGAPDRTPNPTADGPAKTPVTGPANSKPPTTPKPAATPKPVPTPKLVATPTPTPEPASEPPAPPRGPDENHGTPPRTPRPRSEPQGQPQHSPKPDRDTKGPS